jgi:antitoxin component YwqK of YwqJK toxin-antitoxin module
MNKNIRPLNNNGQPHGYWEVYYLNDNLWYKGNYVNSQRHGYWEHYFTDGEVYYKGYYDMGKEVDYVVVIDTPSKEMFPIH